MTFELVGIYLYVAVLAAATVGYLAGFTCSYLPRMLRPPKAPLDTAKQVRIESLTRELMAIQRRLATAESVVVAYEEHIKKNTALNRRALFRALYNHRNPE